MLKQKPKVGNNPKAFMKSSKSRQLNILTTQGRWFVQKDVDFACILLEIFLAILKTPVISDKLLLDNIFLVFIETLLI